MKKNILYVCLFLIFASIVFYLDAPRQKEINKYNCAVYGKMEDCKTPLPADQRLK